MCGVITHDLVKKRSVYINKWLCVNKMAFVLINSFCAFDRICVKLLQLMCAVITHNSVKKRSLYINKWLS